MTTVGQVRNQGAQGLRDQRETLPRVADGGWHLSWFNGVQGIQTKLDSFAHQECNKSVYSNDRHLQSCIKKRKDFLNRGMKAKKVGQAFFPDYFNKAWRDVSNDPPL